MTLGAVGNRSAATALPGLRLAVGLTAPQQPVGLSLYLSQQRLVRVGKYLGTSEIDVTTQEDEHPIPP